MKNDFFVIFDRNQPKAHIISCDVVKTGLKRYRREEDDHDHDHDHEGDHEDDHEDNTENETGSACDFCTFSNFCFVSKA